MTSSRGWGDRVETIDPALSLESRRHLRRTLIVLAGLACLAVAAWAALSYWSKRDRVLTQVRILLREADGQADSHERLRAAERAEKLLRAAGADDSTSHLFLATALAVQLAENPHTPVRFESELDERLTAVRLENCTISDLTLAASLFYASGKLHQSDWIVSGALQPSPHQTSEQRQAALRTAARIRFDLGEESRVLEHCYELADLAPEDPFPWRVITLVYEQQNAPEAIIEAYRKLLEFESDSPELRRKLAARLIEVGNAPEAREQVEWLRTHAPAEWEEHAMLAGELLLLEGKPEEAERLADRRLEQDPDAADALLLKSRVLISRQEYAEAIALLTALISDDPAHAQAHYLLGNAYARSGERELAQQHLDRQRKLLDTMVELHRLQRLVGRDPHDAELRLKIAFLYELLGDEANSRHWRESAMAAHRSSGN